MSKINRKSYKNPLPKCDVAPFDETDADLVKRVGLAYFRAKEAEAADQGSSAHARAARAYEQAGEALFMISNQAVVKYVKLIRSNPILREILVNLGIKLCSSQINKVGV